MDNRVLIKASTTENSVCFRTISRERKSPRGFYILKSNLLRLRQESYIVVNDIYCFAELYRETNARVTIRFYWLRENTCNGDMSGWNQTVSLPLAPLLDLAECGDTEKWRVLSIKDTFSPRIVFMDHRNLRDVVANVTVRRKLARFLSRNFRYRNATEIRMFNDYVPYSFFFREMIGEQSGMCGGMILHGQDDLKTAKYSIHT